MFARHLALAARHHFVPGAGPSPRPVGDHRDRHAPGHVSARIACGDRRGQFLIEQDFDVGVAIELPLSAVDQPFVVRIASIQLAEKFAALLRLKSENKARLALEQQLLAPGGELVGPGFDRK